MATFNDMTDRQKVEHIINELLRRKYESWQLAMRAKRGLSSAAAYQTKLAVNIVMNMSQDDINYFLNNEKYKPYIQMFLFFSKELKKKEMNKSIDKSDKFSKIISDIKEMIEPIIKDQQEKIEKSIRSTWKSINKEYEDLGEQQFKQKYGKKVYRYRSEHYYLSMTDFYRSFQGSLLNKPERYLEREIQAQKESYKDKEHAKVNKLISNLNERYTDIDNIKLVDTNRSVNGIEFTMTADMDNKELIINTSTIYAGGYNIQKLHLRWLMHVIDKETGKTISSFKGV